MLRTLRALAASLIALALALSGCSTNSSQPAAGANWRTAPSAQAGGGMEALVAAAKAEGALNVMGLYADWANYGGVIDGFTKKYGIKVNNDVSQGSSQDQINAIQQRVGQDRSLDYLDTGIAFANQGADKKLLAQYTPATAQQLAPELHHPDHVWTSQYGGFMSLGCDTSRVKNCPTSFKDLLKPEYKNQVAALEDPRTGEMQFNAIWAMSVANGGSMTEIQPGMDFYAALKKSGNLTKVTPKTGTIERGETPIVIAWDYTTIASAAELKKSGITFQVNVPTDAVWSAYYAASINADAPHPAAARLWLEYIFSDEGQNLFLKGNTRPVRLAEMQSAGTLDTAAYAALPPVSGTPHVPNEEQRKAARDQLIKGWEGTVK